MAPPQHQRRSLYSLTSLQLGDMQSYVSKLYLHVGKKKLVFFVDNGPWSAERSQRSKPVEFWQLMVTQSRISPFANRSARYALIDREITEDLDTSTADVSTVSSKRRLFHMEQSRLGKFFHDRFGIRLRSVVRMQELSRLLYGCVTFEVEWKNVRGINYLNELQTDTCVALEIKLLVKREFCNIKEASAFYGIEHSEVLITSSQWRNCSQKGCLKSKISSANAESYAATLSFDKLFRENNSQRVDHNHRDDQCCVSNSDCELFDAVCQVDRNRTLSFDTDSCICDRVARMGLSAEWRLDAGLSVDGELDADCSIEFFDAIQCSCKLKEESRKETIIGFHEICPCSHSPNEEGGYQEESDSATLDSPHGSDDTSSSCSLQDEDEEESLLVFRDTLLIFRFCDLLLPLELRQVVTADQRLLKMLESGLPSWVIFLQSYPVVRKLYRPWMRPLVKTMYILISIITVIIGFYDLYKNVPVLKSTAARICGPFFEWIEAWEMVSRVKYLGTVLFLQNWEKGFRWLLSVFGTVRKLSNLIVQPLVEPLEEFVWPAWNLILDSVWGITSLIWMMCTSVMEYTSFILQLFFFPFIWLLTAISSLVAWVLYPIVAAFWGLIILPIRFIMLLIDCAVAAICYFYKAIQSFWVFVNSTFQLFFVAGPQAERTANSSASTLRLLWNDIFSRVFRAVRSIVNVFVAFFTTCNRHRLSIYNHMEAFILQLRDLKKSAPLKVSNAHHQRGVVDEGHKRGSRGSLGGHTPRLKSRKKGALADK